MIINNNNNNNKNINTFFKIKFPKSIHEKNENKKFNYEAFLTNNHDSWKYRDSTFISIINIDVLEPFLYGCFNKGDMNWIFYIPRIVNFNKDEDIRQNEIINIFINNLQKDMKTNNMKDLYVVLVNMYESLPKNIINDNTVDITFYKLLSINCICNSINEITSPTFCHLAQKLSQQKTNCKQSHMFFLNDINMKNKPKLMKFMNSFRNLIKDQYYNFLINGFNFYYDNYYNNDNDDYSKIMYNDIKCNAINLIKRCQIDNNVYFIYSNLGTKFFKSICKPFEQDDVRMITCLFAILKVY